MAEGSPVPANQKTVCHILEKHPELILPTRINNKKNKVEISVKDQFISLNKFVFGKDRELVDYYEKLLLLFSNMCAVGDISVV